MDLSIAIAAAMSGEDADRRTAVGRRRRRRRRPAVRLAADRRHAHRDHRSGADGRGGMMPAIDARTPRVHAEPDPDCCDEMTLCPACDSPACSDHGPSPAHDGMCEACHPEHCRDPECWNDR